MDCIRRDFESLECLPIKYVRGAALINEDLGHHEIDAHDGENHEVVLVDRVDALEVSIGKCYRRETSW